MSVGASTDIGQSVPVLYAGAQGQDAGLDLVNVQIPPSPSTNASPMPLTIGMH